MENLFSPQIATQGPIKYRLNRYGTWFITPAGAIRERFLGVVRRCETGLEVSIDQKTWHPVLEQGLSAALNTILSLQPL